MKFVYTAFVLVGLVSPTVASAKSLPASVDRSQLAKFVQAQIDAGVDTIIGSVVKAAKSERNLTCKPIRPADVYVAAANSQGVSHFSFKVRCYNSSELADYAIAMKGDVSVPHDAAVIDVSGIQILKLNQGA